MKEQRFPSNIVDRCADLYGMTLSEFAKHYHLSHSNLKRWRDPAKLTPTAKLLFQTMIEIKEMGLKHREEMADMQKKVDLLDGIAEHVISRQIDKKGDN